ncbi:site-specific integrase [Streptomyces sp.]|uniref:tyrosine-type recombinase/integrase n=1 Tax=Streptomyces sp. TaxID=1931 RepID=UPI002F927D2A
MAVYDRWHRAHPRPGHEPCKCGTTRTPLYPTAEHGQGDRWQVRWYDDEGKQRKLNRPKKGGKNDETDHEIYAEALDAKVRNELNTDTYIDPKAGKVTLESYAKDWRANLAGDPVTLSRVDSILKVHLYGKPIGKQTMAKLAKRPSIVQQWLSGMAKLEPSTVRNNMRVLNSVLIAALDDGVIGRNPTRARSVKPPKVVRKDVIPWTLQRAETARSAMADHLAAMVDAAMGCGLRQGECFGLALDGINWLGREVNVIRQVRLLDDGTFVFSPPKGDKTRTVPLHERDSLRLAAHISAHGTTTVTLPWVDADGPPHTAELLFTKAGKPLHRQHFNRDDWRPARRAAGAPDIRANGFHVLRHTFASAQLAGGLDIKTLAVYLGHADPGFTLNTYTHLMPTAADRARKAMDEFYKITDPNALNMPGEESR